MEVRQRRACHLLTAICLVGACVLIASSSQAVYPAQGDDNTTSLGSFKIRVVVAKHFLFAGFPPSVWDPVEGVLSSPTLFDSSTVIGRSGPHADGDASDGGGTAVGSLGTIVSDSDFTRVPDGFEGPPGTQEVHTEIVQLNLLGQGMAVRAGDSNFIVTTRSPGEVEEQPGETDFPAESFFDVFVEVQIDEPQALFWGGMNMLLRNPDELLITNSELLAFPPKVVYQHEGPFGAGVYFLNHNPPFWIAGEPLGHLQLAGHGVEYTPAPLDVQEFEDIVATFPLMGAPPELMPLFSKGVPLLPPWAYPPLAMWIATTGLLGMRYRKV